MTIQKDLRELEEALELNPDFMEDYQHAIIHKYAAMFAAILPELSAMIEARGKASKPIRCYVALGHPIIEDADIDFYNTAANSITKIAEVLK